jgi:DNA-binding NtrC family response regulator
MNPQILIAWIGRHDIWAMAADRSDDAELDRKVKAAIGTRPSGPAAQGPGAIRTLVNQVPFGTIHLINNLPAEIGLAYRQWLAASLPDAAAVSIEVHTREIPNPNDYSTVFVVAREVFETACRNRRIADEHAAVLLSSGTAAMVAVSVLLAKTRFQPMSLYQTDFSGKYWIENLPFDITLDFQPELLQKDRDRVLSAAALHSPLLVEGFRSIVGDSIPIRRVVDHARRAAIRDVNVLITGESGTGKELFARAMHLASPRGKNDTSFVRFVSVNCAAIPRELFEGELFGVAKGAATQTSERPGAFELAHGGTLFLDEVGECSPEHQAKLLRALQPRPADAPSTRWIRRVGASAEMPFDVRVIAATNRNLLDTVSEHGYRDDLYYRLASFTLHLPPLRDRASDIPLLAESLLASIDREFRKSDPTCEDHRLSPAAMKLLRQYRWPGNVRELNNVLVHAAVMANSHLIGPADIDGAIPSLRAGRSSGPFSRTRGDDFDLLRRLSEIERAFIEDALQQTGGNQTQAAKLLKISQQALSKKLQRPRPDSH